MTALYIGVVVSALSFLYSMWKQYPVIAVVYMLLTITFATLIYINAMSMAAKVAAL